MSNIQKRILTSLVILPLSLFFVLKGGYFLTFFLIFVLCAGMHELFSVFKKKANILFLSLILILSLFSIYYLRNNHYYSVLLLYWVIILCICSDIGRYAFGKIFKWKKLTKISPNKTVSGVLGSFFFSFVWLVIANEIWNGGWSQFSAFFDLHLLDESGLRPDYLIKIELFGIKYFLLTIIFSALAQVGDLTISYFKRLEKIKDTGKILPGHGGIFDRIDGLMFVLIFTFVFYKLNIIP